MRLRHIEIFHAIYTTGSITNAAKVLHVSQPSVSKVLIHAEAQLGFNLFDRVKGRLNPTDEADMLFDEVDKIYQQIRSIKNTAENIKKSEFGNINLGLTPALGFNVVPNAVAEFHQIHPQVHFNTQTVHNDEVMHALLEHRCDLAVLFSPKEMSGITSIECAQSELVIVYPKKLFPEQPKSLSIEQLKEFEFIDISNSGPLGDMLSAKMMKEGFSLHSSIKVETFFIAVRLVAQGVGVCVVDKHTAMGNLCDNIAYASFDTKLSFSINLLHLENRHLPKVTEEFIPFITKAIEIS